MRNWVPFLAVVHKTFDFGANLGLCQSDNNVKEAFKKMILLIYPPVAKPCEPPPGLARLAGALNHHGMPNKVVDFNVAGIRCLLQQPVAGKDTWTYRAASHLQENLAAMQHRGIYQNIDRYKRTVMDINRVLHRLDGIENSQVSLANYQDAHLLPVRSTDLIKASETFEKNPFYPFFNAQLMFLMKKFRPDIVGFSLNYLSQAVCTFAMIGFLRNVSSDIKIIAGGGLITTWMRNPVWKNPFDGLVDNFVAGAGEKTLLESVGVIEGEQFYTPDYSGFKREQYLSPGIILPYSASSGCYWNRCSFCPEKAEATPYNPVPGDRVIRDLELLIEKNRPDLVHFLDNAISPALLKRLVADPPKAGWYGFARISKYLADPNFCFELKQAGCVMLKLGLESGDPDVLDGMQKGIDPDLASTVLRNLKKAGIATYVYLLFGTVFETLDAARRTLDFTVAHAGEIGFLNLAIFNLPAYGPDVDTLVTEDFYTGDLGLYRAFVHPKGWHRKRVRQFLDREFKRHPAVAAILKNDPPVFTSNHAPFFADITKTTS